MSKSNKTLRRQQAAEAAAGAPVTEEVLSDELDTSAGEQVQGSDVDDQTEVSLEGDRSLEDSAEGSDTPEIVSEFSEGLVGDESDGHAIELRGDVPGVIAVDEQPFLLETPVSEEEQAASTAALLEQEPQPEPDAEGRPQSRLNTLLAGYTLETEQPVINPDVGGQMGFDPTLAPADDAKVDEGEPTEPVGELPPAEGADLSATEESVEDEQDALDAPEPESFASVSTPADIATILVTEPVVELPVVEEGAEVDYTTYSTAQLRNVLIPAVGKIPAEAWSREDMLLYLLKGVYPQKTGRNNWIYDARRAHRVKTWSHTEILDFIEGKLKLDPHVNEDDVWEEAYARYKIPASWTIEAFREYVCNGSVPEYTANGLLVNDRQRDQKQSGHLTFREIRGALMGHIQVRFTREELLAQYRKRLGISSSFSEERLLAEMPNQPDEVSMDNTILRAKLDEYKSAITKNAGTQSEQTAGECQGMLYKAIRDVIKREYNDFAEGWNIILDFVNDNYTALFSPYVARRGWSQVPLGKSQLQLFEDLLTVIVATREPGNRAKKQTYNLEIVLRHLPEENQRQNLFMYYGQ